MKKPSLILSFVMLISINIAFTQVAKSGYKIVNKIHLEGDGGYDYLTMDGATSRLYISHGTIVQVFDVNEKKVVGTIPDTKVFMELHWQRIPTKALSVMAEILQ